MKINITIEQIDFVRAVIRKCHKDTSAAYQEYIWTAEAPYSDFTLYLISYSACRQRSG